MTIRIGTSGWIYAHWRGRFYPEAMPVREWFDHYCRSFDTVEINNTFYRLPEPGAFQVWRRQSPPGFLYAVKASRFLTHNKKLKDAREPVRRLFARAFLLRDRLGPVLYQLPPRWKRNAGRLREFCRLLPDRGTHVFEFRGVDWLTDEIFGILDECGAGLCVHDLIERHPRRVCGSLAYVRFHGATGAYRGSYSRRQLRQWADWILDVAATGLPVYVYFNNDTDGHAVYNALTLRELVERGR